MKALCNEMRGAEESMQNIPRSPPQPNPACPKTFQNGGPGRPWTPKCTQEAPQTGQEMPKRAQDAPEKHPRSVQEEPRDAQERPRATPESPRTLQNGARQIQRQVFSTILVGSFVRKAPGVILFGLFVCASSLRFVKNLDLCRSCQCFVRVGAFAQCCLTCMQKH